MYCNNTLNQENIPKALSKEELKKCFVEYEKGDMHAREKAIEHNIRLVIHRVNTRFSNFPFDPEEMFAYGLIGLIKSVDTFDVNKNNQFATYAARCIDNEILMYARRENKHACTTNLETILATDVDGNEMKYEDVLEDQNITFVEDYEDKEEVQILLKLIQELSEADKKMLFSSIGICGYKRKTQKELANELGISQSYVSRRQKKIIKNIGHQYELYCNKQCKASMLSENRTIGKDETVKQLRQKYATKEELDTSKMLQDPKFRDIINLLDERTKLVVLLNLESGFKRNFTAEEIALSLGIEASEVTNITKNVLLEYKNCIGVEKEDDISKAQKINKKVNLEV